jgi:hypothetical protein
MLCSPNRASSDHRKGLGGRFSATPFDKGTPSHHHDRNVLAGLVQPPRLGQESLIIRSTVVGAAFHVAVLPCDDPPRLATDVGAYGLFLVVETHPLLLVLSARYPDVQQGMLS